VACLRTVPFQRRHASEWFHQPRTAPQRLTGGANVEGAQFLNIARPRTLIEVSEDFSGLDEDSPKSGGATLLAVLAYLILVLVIAAPLIAVLILAAVFFTGGFGGL
jgi:hypothetical protein